VYDVWMRIYLERICSAIDDLPSDLDFNLLQQSELQFQESPGVQLSQEAQPSQQSGVSSQPSLVGSHAAPLNISFTQSAKQSSKRTKK